MQTNIEELRKKYINNPPEGLTSKDIRSMSDEELLDMDYFLNEDDLFDDEAGVEDDLRIVAAQAADELLSLRGVNASFVIYRSGDAVAMSGRSNGDVNVQIVLERLGGGGNSNVAGGRVENAEVGAVREKLLSSLDEYFEK